MCLIHFYQTNDFQKHSEQGLLSFVKLVWVVLTFIQHSFCGNQSFSLKFQNYFLVLFSILPIHRCIFVTKNSSRNSNQTTKYIIPPSIIKPKVSKILASNLLDKTLNAKNITSEAAKYL